jgi:hypothetical protein
MKHYVTQEIITALHNAHLEKYKNDPSADAVKATRTEVYALLQIQVPVPKGKDGDDPDEVWVMQKKHGKLLWAETDKIVNDALTGKVLQ